ncbi:MAG: hypothetical protein HC902_04580 [Calothrix sp. SM1_5_4]|nr:hypothetical protein [Calothrix sp. SM1_5_4]
MKRYAMAATILFFCVGAAATTHNVKGRQIYRGKETYNQKFTGNSCFLTIRDAAPVPEKGLHCHGIVYVFNSVRTDLPKEELHAISRVTNYHSSGIS